jgi:hypothetical protein
MLELSNFRLVQSSTAPAGPQFLKPTSCLNLLVRPKLHALECDATPDFGSNMKERGAVRRRQCAACLHPLPQQRAASKSLKLKQVRKIPK